MQFWEEGGGRLLSAGLALKRLFLFLTLYLKAINLDLSYVLPREWNKALRSLIKGEKLFEHLRVPVFMCGRPGVTKEFNQTTSLIKTTLPELNADMVVGTLKVTIKKSDENQDSSSIQNRT